MQRLPKNLVNGSIFGVQSDVEKFKSSGRWPANTSVTRVERIATIRPDERLSLMALTRRIIDGQSSSRINDSLREHKASSNLTQPRAVLAVGASCASVSRIIFVRTKDGSWNVVRPTDSIRSTSGNFFIRADRLRTEQRQH